ncbi:hypothetical protein HOI26_02925 [Candidatus Woesearchaeota archaeon]|nr:hypothetical protein [Candidatus Woesearchaeota archaeon]MBT5740031.1 hypothetical protein [Candidatus Woesearchaeota archaeon]
MVDKLEDVASEYSFETNKEMKDYIANNCEANKGNLSYNIMPRSVEYDCDCGDGSNCDS